MPIHGYPGNIITANPTAPTVSAASGVWTTEQQLQAVSQGNWPGYEYPISRSLRFNSADTAYLSRTGGTSTNRKIHTFSFWTKYVVSGGTRVVISAGSDDNNREAIFIDGDKFDYQVKDSGSFYDLISTQVFRDPSAWYHFVVAVDTTQATSSNRVKVYVNGSQITAFGTASYPPQNDDLFFNDSNGGTSYIGALRGFVSSTFAYNGYITEFNFIDGQALTPSSFGLNDPETGIWSPKQYTGPYGTNGFYLNFSDNSGTTSTTLGKDSSGNGNNWTPSGFSVTAGAGDDSVVDTPTSYGTDTGVGGEVRGNYATLNPLIVIPRGTISNGNLNYLSGSTSSHGSAAASFTLPTTGKWYWEVTACNNSGGSGNNESIGIANIQNNPQLPAAGSEVGSRTGDYIYRSSGVRISGGSSVSYGATYTNGDVIGVAWDSDAGTLVFYKNGVSQGTAYSSITQVEGRFAPASSNAETSNGDNYNFGQRPFEKWNGSAYVANTAPSGFKALCTQNLPTPTIGATSTTQANDYFNVATWTGNDATRTITGYGFQPDFIWTKGRNVAAGHRLSDAVRGASSGTMLNLNTASTGAENTDTAITGFASDGFTMDGSNHPNVSPYTYVGWGWKANGAGSSNTAGTITSTVSANTTAGFSIATFTMPASGTSDTVGHGLGVAPAMVIVKSRGSSSWGVYHKNLTSAAYYLTLQTTNGETSSNSYWNSTAPTSTVFTLGATWYGAGTMVAYSFAEVAGYSAYGSYSGNNSSTDGTFVYLGFRPRFIMIKSTSAGTDWVMMDSARNTYNLADTSLYANSANSESTIGTVNDIDFLSNGFKLRNNTGFVNASQTYVYAAFAESPFKYALAR